MHSVYSRLIVLVAASAAAVAPMPALSEGINYTYCLDRARDCSQNYASLGFAGSGECWDVNYAEECPETAYEYDPVRRSYVRYGYEVHFYYGSGSHIPPTHY